MRLYQKATTALLFAALAAPAAANDLVQRADHPPDYAGSAMMSSGLMGATLAVLIAVPPNNWSAHGEPRWEQFKESWSKPPIWNDGDRWATNYVGHPLQGSQYYLFARQNRSGPLGAFASATLASFTWEYLLEAWFERPSWPDLLITSPSGMLLGEARWQLLKRLVANGTPGPLGQVGLFFVDPISEVRVLVGYATGDRPDLAANELLAPSVGMPAVALRAVPVR